MLQTTLTLLIFLFPLAYSPGPGNLFFAANGARFGFRATLPANVGYHLATWFITVALGFGFNTTIEHYPQILFILKLTGSLYVFWLAWGFLTAGVLQNDTDPKPANISDGIILLILNPKAYVIIALMFSQFLDQNDTEQFGMVLWITTVFTLNNLIAFSIWTLAGDRLAKLFRTPRHAHGLNLIFGIILALVALWMMFS